MNAYTFLVNILVSVESSEWSLQLSWSFCIRLEAEERIQREKEPVPSQLQQHDDNGRVKDGEIQ